MPIDFGQLREIQKQTAKQVSVEDEISQDKIKHIAGFDVAFAKNKMVCAAVVMDFKSLTAVEKKHIITSPPMQYIPELIAFRDGPAIMQLYYDLEYEPDVILVAGHGITDPNKSGLANYVGVELHKPTIGVAKNLIKGEVKDGKIIIDGEVVGEALEVKKHAKPLYVSPGHMISIPTASAIVKYCVIPPHKLPEPLHAAHRLAKKIAEGLNT